MGDRLHSFRNTYLADGYEQMDRTDGSTKTGSTQRWKTLSNIGSHWERLNDLRRERQVQFRFVKARNGIPYFQRGKELTAEILSRA